EDAHAAAEDRARAAERALERADLRRLAVLPREADARAEIGAVRHEVVAHTERLLDVGVRRGISVEAVRVDAQPVLELEARRALVRVAERDRADVRAAA